MSDCLMDIEPCGEQRGQAYKTACHVLHCSRSTHAWTVPSQEVGRIHPLFKSGDPGSVSMSWQNAILRSLRSVGYQTNQGHGSAWRISRLGCKWHLPVA